MRSLRRWVPGVAAAVVLTVASGMAGAQNELLRDPVEFPDVKRGNNNIDYDSIDYAVRRGWFDGHSDGRFDPLGRLTSVHLVRVIERAFPGGMTRGEFAALLAGGEWDAELTPGRRQDNPIPMGQFWRVGDWDIRVTGAWPQNGWDELESSYHHHRRPPDGGRQYTLVKVEVVYRGTGSTGSFDLGYKVVSDRKYYEGSPCGGRRGYSDWPGNLPGVADIRPGALVSSDLCWTTDAGDNPHVMQIWKGGRWAWFSLTGRAGEQDGLIRDPVEFLDVESGAIGSVDYAVRRGWFEGKADGRFDPLGPLTSAQLVRVIERAFPDGMTRGEFAALLAGGEWDAGLTPGRNPANPIPMGEVWKVGDWDIRVLERWPPDGRTELAQRGYDDFSWSAWSTDRNQPLTIVEVEVVYRGTGEGTYSLGQKMTSDRNNYEEDCVQPWRNWRDYVGGHLGGAARGIRPDAPVSGLLCRSTAWDDDENVNLMQIWGKGRWAWFEI